MPLHIDEMFAFVAEDEEGEGLAAYFDERRGWMPLVAADKARIDGLRPIAQEIADATGKKLTLVRFSIREEVEEFKPKVTQ